MQRWALEAGGGVLLEATHRPVYAVRNHWNPSRVYLRFPSVCECQGQHPRQRSRGLSMLPAVIPAGRQLYVLCLYV
jgi:hypothetical protein